MQQQNRMPLTNKLKTIELELVDYFYSLVVMVSSTVAYKIRDFNNSVTTLVRIFNFPSLLFIK